MKEASRGQSAYALGHCDQELDRLSLQARLFDPFTRQLLEEAGIREGMRVLDIGSGSGDVAFLAARLVGPRGSVIGTDRADEAIALAAGRVKAVGLKNVEFLQGDPAEMKFDQPFDAVIGRLVLMYYPDPVAAVRRLSAHVREGGLIVFHEFDVTTCRSIPPVPSYERVVGWISQALLSTGAPTELGLKLYSIFVAAGWPGPCMRMDAAINGGPDFLAYEVMAEVARSVSRSACGLCPSRASDSFREFQQTLLNLVPFIEHNGEHLQAHLVMDQLRCHGSLLIAVWVQQPILLSLIWRLRAPLLLPRSFAKTHDRFLPLWHPRCKTVVLMSLERSGHPHRFRTEPTPEPDLNQAQVLSKMSFSRKTQSRSLTHRITFELGSESQKQLRN